MDVHLTVMFLFCILICFGEKTGDGRRALVALSGFKTTHLHFYFAPFLILSLTSRHIHLKSGSFILQSELKREQLKGSWLEGYSSEAQHEEARADAVHCGFGSWRESGCYIWRTVSKQLEL